MDLLQLKRIVAEELDASKGDLVDLSLKIHSNPEPAFQEHKASQWLAQYLEAAGYAVEKGICGLETAFRASYGDGKPVIALLAEYDALPDMGHACGHNIIGTAAVGAARALKQIADMKGGQVVVLGTPAEEKGAGKAILVERGALADAQIAMMVHPGARDNVVTTSLASIGLEVEFFGRAAHAAARPQEGINALEAMIMAYNAINALRQHIPELARIHGIITDGGSAPNIVPAHSAAHFLVRAADESRLAKLKEQVLQCFQGAALATGARLEYRWAENHYAPMRTNKVLADVFAENLQSLGRVVPVANHGRGRGSTDMGNVSAVVPAIHPSIAMAPRNIAGHTPEFAVAAASERGHQGLMDGAKALAMTAVDLLVCPEIVDNAWEEFRNHDRSESTGE